MKKTPIDHQPTKGSVSVVKRLEALNQTQRHAVLATVINNQPYTSLVAFALTSDRQGVVFATPKETHKYRNISENNSVSLLIDSRCTMNQDYTESESITIEAIARPINRDDEQYQSLSAELTEKHPALDEFVNAPSTALILAKINRCVHVSRFQTVTEWDLV